MRKRTQRQPKKTAKKKVIWLFPPFNKSVKTRIGKVFLRLVQQNFPKHHKFNEIFSLSTSDVSYSCTTNMVGNIIIHSSLILQSDRKKDHQKCNCRNCPTVGWGLEICKIRTFQFTLSNLISVNYVKFPVEQTDCKSIAQVFA